MMAICGEDLSFFFLVFTEFCGDNATIFGEDLFLFLVFIQFRRRKYIISTKVFVKLVKAAKVSPHAKFYNLSTG